MLTMLMMLMMSLPVCVCVCPAGNFKGMCKQIDHFPEDTDYEADPSEYFLREYRPVCCSLQHSGCWRW